MRRAPAIRDCGRGYTLIEMVGVLAIVALLAALLIPAIHARMDQAARTREQGELKVIADAMQARMLQNRSIPVLGGMAALAADELLVDLAKVTTTSRRTARAFVLDPRLNIGGNLPFAQAAAGLSAEPTNARVMIVSSVGRALPITTGVAGAPADFDVLWNLRPGAVPTGTDWATWTGRGDDLNIQRVDLRLLFHKVLLMNSDAQNPGGHSIDSFGVSYLNGFTRVVKYVMNGTALNLYKPGPALEVREIIREDESFVYLNNRWGQGLREFDIDVLTFGGWVDAFLQNPAPADPKFSATQRAVVDAFYNYLWGYATWAFGDAEAIPLVPPFAGAASNNTPQYPSYTVVNNSQAIMADFTFNLIN